MNIALVKLIFQTLKFNKQWKTFFYNENFYYPNGKFMSLKKSDLIDNL